MVYCSHDSHSGLRAKVGSAFACRSPAHKKKWWCDSECKDEYASGVTCCGDPGHTGRCIGPNGPAWEHPKDCNCRDWPKKAPLPVSQTLLGA